MLRIALVGYGKMGKSVEKEATARGHTISHVIDKENIDAIHSLSTDSVDVIIEFTHPESILSNLRALLPTQIPIVTGTTGWDHMHTEVQQWVKTHQASLLFSSNFSVGVNILFKLNQKLAQIMNAYPAYDCFIEERHHRYKMDAPSGTAMTLAQQIIESLEKKDKIVTSALQNRKPNEDELSIGSIRSGEIIGQHTVSYTSAIDTISILHTAHNRRGFALGAVIAAEWLHDKRGMYNFADIFD